MTCRYAGDAASVSQLLQSGKGNAKEVKACLMIIMIIIIIIMIAIMLDVNALIVFEPNSCCFDFADITSQVDGDGNSPLHWAAVKVDAVACVHVL